MPRIKQTEGTIYNEPRGGIPTPLANATATRTKTIKEKQKEINHLENNKLDAQDVVEKTRNESIIKMKQMTENRAQILFQTKTVFPFDFFPDELIISGTKIEVKHNTFWRSYSTITIPLQDIGHVEMSSTPFFATMKIINIRVKDPVRINYLPTKKAEEAKKIINGLLIAQESGVDISTIEPKELLPQIESLAS